jgi:hypothetical protein
MGKMSNYLENALLNATLRNTTYTSPATVYLSLHTADPTDAGTGAEASGDTYVRESITFDAPSNGVTANSADVEFPVAGASWGTITHVGIWDALSSGNLLYYGALNTPRTISADNQLVFLAGEVTVTLD